MEDEDGIGFAIGVLLGPLVLLAALPLLACLLAIFMACVRTICVLAILPAKIIGAVGHALITASASEWTISWTLVAAQMTIGALLGFAIGLRAPKPDVRR